MSAEINFRQLIHSIAEGLTAENVRMIRYLCKDAIPHGMELPTAISFFEYFETKGWINFGEMSFLAEVLYRINRHDLLKRLPGVKNRRDYEEAYMMGHFNQNFSPYRVACFQIIEELTVSDFQTMRNFCRDKLSSRNYQKSNDIISMLVCLEEEDLMSDGDLEFIVSSLQHLDNQTPYKIFDKLRSGDTSITLPKKYQSFSNLPSSSSSNAAKAPYHRPHSQSLPQFPHASENYPSSTPFYSDFRQGYQPTGTDPPTGMFYAGYEHAMHEQISDQPLQPPSRQTHGNWQKPYGTANYIPPADEANRAFAAIDLPGDSDCKKQVTAAPMANLSMTRHARGEPPTEIQQTTNQFQSLQFQSNETLLKQPETIGQSLQPRHRQIPSNELYEVDSQFLTMQLSSNIPDASVDAQRSFQPENDSGEEGPHSRQEYTETDSNMTMACTISSSKCISQEEPSMSSHMLPLERYAMNKHPIGICLIINNNNFEGEVNEAEAERRLQMGTVDYATPNVGLKNRDGSEKDAENAERLFKKFGFEVKRYNDLDQRALVTVIADCAKLDHRQYDCFVAVIMSHGLEGCIYGIDGMPVSVSKISKTFKPQTCPSLAGKPKLFFFQACQGDRGMDGHSGSSHGAPVADIEADSGFQVIPAEADFLIGHSTVPGYLSYRSRTDGSWFISSLVENLEKYHASEDVLSIMIKVNSEMANKPYKQMSMPIATLRKKVYFSVHNKSTESGNSATVAQKVGIQPSIET